MPERRAVVENGAILDLRLLATTDLHAHLLAWDYAAHTQRDQVGLARVATLIAAARREQAQSLLFDNGDFLHGSALGDYLAETTPTLRSGRPLHAHPMIAAMNHLHYDAACLGNHEFGFGLGFLRRSLAATRFPIVCSNLHFKPSRGAALSQPYLLLERSLQDRDGKPHLIRIGVLGFIPPQTMSWERRYLKSRASVDDIVAAAHTVLPEVRRAGADLVVALAHSGIGELSQGAGAENAATALAAVDGIDVVIAGHTHLLFPTADQKDLCGKPAVMAGFHGSHLGVIDLQLHKAATGRWVIRHHQAETRAISQRDPVSGQVQALVADDPAVVEIAAPMHNRLLARANTVIAQTPIALHSFFALLTDTPALRLVARAQAARLGRELAGTGLQDLPILSAVAPFRAGGRGGPENFTDIPAGPLRLRHAGDLYIHPNSLSALRVTGADVAAWLERSVSLYHQIAPGAQDAVLLDDRFPSFNFDVIAGLTYRIDLSQPARFDPQGRVIRPEASRIRDLRHNGSPVRPDQVFVLATNSYRAAGGAGFAGTVPAQVIYEGREGNREVLAAYLQAGGALETGHPAPDWGFVPMPGTTATVDTAPAAAEHLAEVPHLRLQPLQLLPDGFRRFRLHL